VSVLGKVVCGKTLEYDVEEINMSIWIKLIITGENKSVDIGPEIRQKRRLMK